MNKKPLIVISIIVAASTILSLWIGWYATAIGLGVFGVWFGVTLWRAASLDAKILFLLAAEVILIWLAFSLAYLEMTSEPSDAFSISIQNLLHFDFINIPDELSNSIPYRMLAVFEGFVGYLLIVSGVALLVAEKTKSHDRGKDGNSTLRSVQ